jgi:hypothetical protein
VPAAGLGFGVGGVRAAAPWAAVREVVGQQQTTSCAGELTVVKALVCGCLPVVDVVVGVVVECGVGQESGICWVGRGQLGWCAALGGA